MGSYDDQKVRFVSNHEKNIDGLSVVALSSLSEKELARYNELCHLYQPSHQTIIDLDEVPNCIYPINPAFFLPKAIQFLESKGVLISEQIPIIIRELCIIFNECIINQNIDAVTKSRVYPAQTGIGKSVSLQVYISMLKNYSSLVVVSTVETAIKYCETINILSGDNNYARTTYAITQKNKKHNLRVENAELKNYRAIVITHKMFKIVNQNVVVDLYRLYQKQQRDLVVIDEKLSMYEQYKISYKGLEKLKNNLESILSSCDGAQDIDPNKDAIAFLNSMQSYLEDKEKDIITDKKALRYIGSEVSNEEMMDLFLNSDGSMFVQDASPIGVIAIENFKNFMNENNLEIEKVLSLMRELFQLKIEQIFSDIKKLGGFDNPAYKQQTIHKILEPVDILEQLFSEWFLLYKSNYENVIFRVDDIAHKLGQNVVLDATAIVNEFYQVANRFLGFIGVYNAKQIRKYENLTIYKAKGYVQSRHELYDKGDAHTINNAKSYSSYALSLLINADDKLLIICHKKFEARLRDYCDDPRIRITHWGDHVGKNDWSDCNKVMVVGWNYLNPLENISDIYSAAREIDLVSVEINYNIIDKFAATQIADDLVQAVMRSKARIIATNDSDCEPTEVYLFYNDDIMSNKVLEIFENQFQQAKIEQWTPQGIPFEKNKNTRMKKVDSLIEILKEKEATQTTYLLSELIIKTKIPKSSMTNIIKSDYFSEQLKIHGYLLQDKNGREKYFILR